MIPLRRVLLVEDEHDIQTVARLALEDIGGFELHVCASSEAALDEAPAFAPQLVLLDDMLPGMSGRDAMRAFAGSEPLADVPVVFLTARAQHDEVAEYRRLGALGVITKPFDPMTLAQQVEALWQRRSSAS
ncbi:MAG: response regulator [Acidobacteriota bacterium]